MWIVASNKSAWLQFFGFACLCVSFGLHCEPFSETQTLLHKWSCLSKTLRLLSAACCKFVCEWPHGQHHFVECSMWKMTFGLSIFCGIAQKQWTTWVFWAAAPAARVVSKNDQKLCNQMCPMQLWVPVQLFHSNCAIQKHKVNCWLVWFCCHSDQSLGLKPCSQLGMGSQ